MIISGLNRILSVYFSFVLLRKVMVIEEKSSIINQCWEAILILIPYFQLNTYKVNSYTGTHKKLTSPVAWPHHKSKPSSLHLKETPVKETYPLPITNNPPTQLYRELTFLRKQDLLALRGNYQPSSQSCPVSILLLLMLHKTHSYPKFPQSSAPLIVGLELYNHGLFSLE